MRPLLSEVRLLQSRGGVGDVHDVVVVQCHCHDIVATLSCSHGDTTLVHVWHRSSSVLDTVALLARVASRQGTNLPSCATPNGQAAFLFVLTSAVRLGSYSTSYCTKLPPKTKQNMRKHCMILPSYGRGSMFIMLNCIGDKCFK